MTYRLAKDVRVLSGGLVMRKGQATGPGVVPPALWQRWIDDGVVVEIGSSEETIDQLRERAKAAGIDYYWSKNADTLREELNDAKD